jgi:hypothetical protein
MPLVIRIVVVCAKQDIDCYEARLGKGISQMFSL